MKPSKKAMTLEAIKNAGDIGITATQIAERVGLTHSAVSYYCRDFVRDSSYGVVREASVPVCGHGQEYYYIYKDVKEAPVQATIIPDKITEGQYDEVVKEQVDQQMTKYRMQICKILDIDPGVSWMWIYNYLGELAAKALVQEEEHARMLELEKDATTLAKKLMDAEAEIKTLKNTPKDPNMEAELEILKRDVVHAERERDIYKYCFDRITEPVQVID